VYVLDSTLNLMPPGVPGEVYLGGESIARGYLNQPELTCERFVPDPFAAEAGARMYRTGDMGRWLADGSIEYLGRNDQQVKVRGYRIELGEIESRLLEYPGIREAVVLVREDAQPETPGLKQLVAYFVSGNTPVDLAELREHLRQSLPEYMVPAAYVQLPRFPLTPNGKIDRKTLPAPNAVCGLEHEYEPPQGETETALVQMWQEVLHVERVSRRDDFFALGGHSLLAIRLIGDIDQLFGIELPLHAIFEHSVLHALAEFVVTLRMTQFSEDDIRTVTAQIDRSLAS